MSIPIIAFLPCRSGSQRVINKNTRPFAGIDGGLVKIKLEQLLACSDINRIVVSTDDNKVIEIAETIAKKYDRKILVIKRPAQLATSETSTDDLIRYLPTIINEGIILWTHVTSPFVGDEIYSKAIHAYRSVIESKSHDSLMSVTKLQAFIWDSEHPLNYDREKEKWPRTQTLPVWHEVNSAIFIANVLIYRGNGDRIGRHPYLFELAGPEAIDIDWESDYLMAEKIWTASEKNKVSNH